MSGSSEGNSEAIGRLFEALAYIDKAMSEDDYPKAMELYSTVPQWIQVLAGRKDSMSILALIRAMQVRDVISRRREGHTLRGTMYSSLADAVAELGLFERAVVLGRLATEEFSAALSLVADDEERRTLRGWVGVMSEKMESWQKGMVERDAERLVREEFARIGEAGSVAGLVKQLVVLREGIPERIAETSFVASKVGELEAKLDGAIAEMIGGVVREGLSDRTITEVIVVADRARASLDRMKASGAESPTVDRVKCDLEGRVKDVIFRAVFTGKIYPQLGPILQNVFKKEMTEGMLGEKIAEHPLGALGRELEMRAHAHMKVAKKYCHEISVTGLRSFEDSFRLAKELWDKGTPVRRIVEPEGEEGSYSVLIGYYVGKESQNLMEAHHEVARDVLSRMNLPGLKLTSAYEEEALAQFVKDRKQKFLEVYQEGRGANDALRVHAEIVGDFPQRADELREAFLCATFQVYFTGKSGLARQIFNFLNMCIKSGMELPILHDEKVRKTIQKVAPVLKQSQGIWSANVAEFTDIEEAVDVGRKLLERGFPVRPFPTTLHKLWLSIGDFETEEKRDSVLASLKSASSEIPISSGRWRFPKL